MPITKIPFPSVSICAEGINYEVLDAAIIKLFLDYRIGLLGNNSYNISATPIQLSKLYNKKYRLEVNFSNYHLQIKIQESTWEVANLSMC